MNLLLANFMIVDCGGGTVDLTTRKVEGNQLGEITERAGDYCGSTFIDREFIIYLRRKLGDEPMDLLENDNNFGQKQYLVQLQEKIGALDIEKTILNNTLLIRMSGKV